MECIIRRLAREDEQQMAALFATISSDPTAAQFHPHPFTETEAQNLATYSGNDVYLGLWSASKLQGYGMLRGWDAGFAIPSLGIYLAPAARGQGASCQLMKALHEHAKRAGARYVRLKVYPDNLPALRLYKKLGYNFAASDGIQLIGSITL